MIAADLGQRHLVRDQDTRLRREQVANAAIVQRLGHVCVHGAQRIVEQVDVSIGIRCAGKGDPLLLTTRERDALLADFRRVALEPGGLPAGELLEVVREGARL